MIRTEPNPVSNPGGTRLSFLGDVREGVSILSDIFETSRPIWDRSARQIPQTAPMAGTGTYQGPPGGTPVAPATVVVAPQGGISNQNMLLIGAAVLVAILLLR